MAPPHEPQPFTPIVPNPFITGGPVRDNTLFFGREEDFAYARQRLETETEGVILLVVGERRSGKTSILFQILNGRLGPGFLPVFVDMQAMAGVTTDREFFAYLTAQLCEQVPEAQLRGDSYEFAQGSPMLTVDRVLDDLRQACPGQRLLVLVDEAELLREKIADGAMSGAVLLSLASAMERRQVSFFMTGSPALGKAPGDPWRRLIGKATSRTIGLLSQEETLQLITRPVAGRVVYGEGVVEAIARLTAGHPYYTQYLCSHVVDYLNRMRRNTAILEDLEQILSMILVSPPPNMLYAWESLSCQEQVTLSLVSEACGDDRIFMTAEQLTRAIHDHGYPLTMEAETLHIHLEHLVERDVLERNAEGAYRFRVELFRRWIRHARSIWRLLEERRPKRVRQWLLAAGVGVALMAAGIVGWLLVRGPSEEERGIPQAGGGTPLHLTMGHLWVTSQPPHAEVWIDGTSRGRTATRIAYLDPGRHVVELRLDRYRPATDTVEVIAGRTDTCQFSLMRLTGTLSVCSTPPGAHVLIHGEIETGGITPLTHLELPTGDYTVEVGKAQYLPQRRTVTIHGDTPHDLSLTLTGIGALVIASMPPGATIVLDGIRQRETTPATVESLAIGAHELHLELATYAAQSWTVAVELGRTMPVDVVLDALPAIFDLRSAPPGATIYLDSDTTAAGRTPDLLRLTPGYHRIRLMLAGHGEEAIEVTCSADEQLPVKTVQLVPQFGVVRIIRPRIARIVVDDHEGWEIPPGDIRLPIGTHTLRLEGPGGAVKDVHVYQDSTVKVSFP